MSTPPFLRSKQHKHANSSAAGADQALSTIFAELFPTQLSLTLSNLQVGDTIIMSLMVGWQTDSDGQNTLFDFGVNGVRLGGTNGTAVYFSVDNLPRGESLWRPYDLTAGDIDANGRSVFVPWVRSSINTVPDIVYDNPPVHFMVANIGPQDPT